MKVIDLNTWNRKLHYEHFIQLTDPYFGLVIPFNVTNAYSFSKQYNVSFFGRYLHDCMKALNEVDNLRYRLLDNKIVEYDKIHASSTIMRSDKTFGFSFIDFNEELSVFLDNIKEEKLRINSTKDLFPPKNGIDCIHCSAMPWLNFTGQKEPVSGELESIPKLAFSKFEEREGKLIMNVSIQVNHALVDGYHIGEFSEKFQNYLNQ